ncbi:hypothetical protein [Winogradskyella jejuensis]|uniref:Outer membrane protein beta-barrel domain-containing protein n=1 Tax=Winogradskyella jejuensis TaxID=1089305 RepID=A0A1M5NWL1_9FLAO|nr:hypothetical protein [Winogradskyella jejuensis]SHG93921.1 hypothetical protein SAMN05444148_1316 [Winogradskyella jejuensis]
MKKILLSITFCSIFLWSNSQSASVEKSVFGIQTGFLGIWAHNESKLSNQFALRTELGLDAGILSNGPNDFGLAFVAAITLEPRWYYNFDRRVDRNKRIDGNSGNFISIKTTYHPDWFVINNNDNINLIGDLSIIPTYGIRRHVGKHFNYEAGFGIGYVRYFKKDNVILFDEDDVAVNLHLRIGYRF